MSAVEEPSDRGSPTDYSDGAGFSDQLYLSGSMSSSPPLRANEIDRWNCHTSLQEFGTQLQTAANATFPNIGTSRYRNVYVLMLKWKNEDPMLPVSLEISKLHDVFQDMYHFNTESWDIPDEDCHAEVNQKILDFKKLGGNSKDDLKIVYYAGHGKLTRNRLLSWTSWQNNKSLKCPTVKWSGIQNVLEEAPSDVLLLLDCCHAGTANTNEGEGLTELISACAYNSKANGVGPYSFTHALVIELNELAKQPYFSVGKLFGDIFYRIQARMPEDGTERHPAPVHLVLTNDTHYRQSIMISSRLNENSDARISVPNADASNADTDSQDSSSQDLAGIKVPRLLFAIRLRENFSASELTTELFTEWLRTIPTVAAAVKVEAGFESFSTLVIVSIPVYLSAYLPSDHAIISLGLVTSSNKVKIPWSIRQHKAALNAEPKITEKFEVEESWEQDREHWEEDKKLCKRSIRVAEAQTQTVPDEFAAFEAVHQNCQRPPTPYTVDNLRDSAYSDTFSERTISNRATSSRLSTLNHPQRLSNRSDLSGLSLAEPMAIDESEEEPVDHDGLESIHSVGLPSHEQLLSKHYTALKTYLSSSLDSVEEKKAPQRPGPGEDKLLRLSSVQLEELSTDVFDELERRHVWSETSPPSNLQPKDYFHGKRNQARQELSTLPPPRFLDLAADVFCELESRFPQFAAKDTSQGDGRSAMQAPLTAPSLRDPPSTALLRSVTDHALGPPGRILQPMEEHLTRDVDTSQSGSSGLQITDDGKHFFEAAGTPDAFNPSYQQAPDEKLLDAINSYDRSLILSIEADFISFVNNSKEPFLNLPPFDSYHHRMLTHKLADYYYMIHQVDAVTGFIRVFRTPFSRLPTSLRILSNSPATGLAFAPPAPTMRTSSDGNIKVGHLRASLETSYLAKEKLSKEQEAAYNKPRKREFSKKKKVGDRTPRTRILSPPQSRTESPSFS